MRILVCGDRHWTDVGIIQRELMNFPEGTVIIQGKAHGADSIAEYIANELGFNIEGYKANWSEHGKAAGPIRNNKMLYEGKPDLVLAFHKNIDESKGTKHMMKIARNAGVNVKLITG